MQPSIRDFLSTFGYALRLVWRSAPRLAVANAILATAQALLPLAAIYTLKRAVDAAAAATHALAGSAHLQAALLQDPHCRQVVFWFVAGAAAMGVAASLRMLASWLSELHAMAISDHVHALLHRKLTEVDIAFFENTEEQNRLHLAQEQAMTRPVSVLSSVFQLLQGMVGFLGVLALLAALHPLVAVALVFAGVPALVMRLRRSRRLYEWRRDLAPLEREAGYFHHLLTSGDYAKELRLQGHGGFCRRRFEAVRMQLRVALLAWRKRVLAQEFIVQILALAVVAVLLLWMTKQLLVGAITLGGLVMYAQVVQRGQGMTGTVVAAVVDLYQSALFLRVFHELLRHPARVCAPAEPKPVPSSVQKGIVFEHVTFIYPGTDRPVLSDLSFVLRPTERLALVGANGAGKSTVVKLLCRLYDPTAGRILVDGVDLREFDPQEWRRHVGVLFQDFGRYQLTAAENIWIGDPQGSAADARVAVAAQRAGMQDMLREWPQGLDTPLGRWLREGSEPSMGQWQRIALARTLLREADVLILDEPTSALDVHTQRDVIRMLQAEASGRMALVVSHRPEMLTWAHRVIVLRNGSVVEDGTPDALHAAGGEFVRLFET